MAKYLPCDKCGINLNDLDRRKKSKHILNHLVHIQECGDCGNVFQNGLYWFQSNFKDLIEHSKWPTI